MRFVTSDFPCNLTPWDSLTGNGIEPFKEQLDNFIKNKESFLPKGCGLYLWSETPQNGKTSLLLNTIRRLASPTNVYEKERMVVSQIGADKFVAPTFARISASQLAERPSGLLSDPDWLEDEKLLSNSHILVIDGLSFRDFGDAQQRRKLLTRLDSRTQLGLVTCFTADMPCDSVGDQLSVATVLGQNIGCLLKNIVVEIQVTCPSYVSKNIETLTKILSKG